MCLASVVAQVRIEQELFDFCEEHGQRAALLQEGQKRNWPALCYEGVSGIYAIDGSPQAYALSALHGTEERVAELLDAIDQIMERQEAS